MPLAPVLSDLETKDIVSLLVGVLGFGAAVLQNWDKITAGFKRLFGLGAFEGKWKGIVSEYNAEDDKFGVFLEEMELKQSNLTVTGTIKSHVNDRVWKVNGTIDQSGTMLVLQYEGEDKDPIRMGSYVLKKHIPGGREKDLFRGYWLGLDVDKQILMAGPYVLTRRKDTDKVKTENKAWLSQKCYYFDAADPNAASVVTADSKAA